MHRDLLSIPSWLLFLVTYHSFVNPNSYHCYALHSTETTGRGTFFLSHRRTWIQRTVSPFIVSIVGGLTSSPEPSISSTISSSSASFSSSFINASSGGSTEVNSKEAIVQPILQSQETLETLLNNWEKATIDCTYADVPRELLETKNKEKLLEKASTFALFDKSVSVTSCKTSNKIVRDYLGVTGKGPLVGIDKKLRKALDFIDDPDQLDDYVVEIEKFSQLLSKASSLSYAAGIADFDAVNNFSKGDDNSSMSKTSNLGQTRLAIEEAKISLDRIVAILNVH